MHVGLTQIDDAGRGNLELHPDMSDENLSNLTPRAQQVLALARKEADRFNHNYVGTEHLLLGLIKLGTGVEIGRAHV